MANEDFIISMHEADIYNDLLDFRDYTKDSELLINLDANKICNFFSQYITFKIPEEDTFIESDDEYNY